ncbi:MAG TPA: hypothetical protein IAA29_12150 [Candidatus Paenibacillus intestinavium]|nr:hypothetical protein [Candidatus Paenibacillus intestinavium]
MKRIVYTVFAFIIGLTAFSLNGEYTSSAAKEIHVYFEGKQLTFDDTDPMMIDSRTMVPFRKIFETLGFDVEWIGGKTQKAIGKKAGLTIELTINSNKAVVNGKTIELDVPAQLHQGRTLVPLRFLSENSGYHVYFSSGGSSYIVGIGSTEQLANPGVKETTPAPSPSTGKVESYIVKGRIVNAQGEPLPYVEVYADNTFLYDSHILGVTDEKGYYRLRIPELNFSYRMGAKLETNYGGKTTYFYMEPVPNHPFIGSDGAVRDFVLDINKGEIELHSWDSVFPEDENAPWLDIEDVELTLKPVGKLVDGSTGRTITNFPIHQDGVRLMEIPVGTYEVTAVWKPKGYKSVPLLVSLRDPEEYKERITITFDNPFGHHYLAKVEVKFPE